MIIKMFLRSAIRSLVRIALRIAAVFITLFLLYLVWYWWDMRQLRAFCDAVHVGIPVSQLQQIADRQGISKKWLKGDGAFNAETQQWSFYVPSAASVGANVCAIRHDKVTVISANIEND